MSDSATGQPLGPIAWGQGEWLHEPRSWQVVEGRLVVQVEPHTDFWRLTHDGAVRHNGHFYGHAVAGDCTITLCAQGTYRSQYDQAGLFILLDEKTWLKTGTEFVDGTLRASVVVTREQSDWSIMPAPAGERLWVRIVRQGTTVEVAFSDQDAHYALARQCTLTASPVRVGPFCCSPGDGFTATFEQFAITRP